MEARLLSAGPPGSGPYALTAGPDGRAWITLVHAGQIARLQTDGRLDAYPPDSDTCRPSQITTGARTAPWWFTRSGDARIGRITTSGAATAFPVPEGERAVRGITAGPDGERCGSRR